MSRARKFSKTEIMDAAKAAAETGLSVRLCLSGDIVFTQDNTAPASQQDNVQEAYESWLNGRKTRGNPFG